MRIASYWYKVGDCITDLGVEISGIDRDSVSYSAYKKYTDEYTKKVTPIGNGKQALIVVGGPMSTHSDVRNVLGTAKSSGIAVKMIGGYGAYNIARMFKNFNFEFIDIDAMTCASGVSAIHKANQLLCQGYTDVIVYAADIIEETQLLLFKQLGVDLLCGDGVGILHISTKGKYHISGTSFCYNNDISPMSVSSEGYKKVINSLNTEGVDLIKMHGSGTNRNTEVEYEAVKGFDCKKIEYKSEVGHTQGASSIVEICMMLDREEFTKALVLASGLGGFYGGCIINKE